LPYFLCLVCRNGDTIAAAPADARSWFVKRSKRAEIGNKMTAFHVPLSII